MSLSAAACWPRSQRSSPFIFWLGSRQLSHHEEPYYTYFTGSVTGLASGSPVRYRGVPVGTVGEIEINPKNIEQIRVTLKMRPNTPIKTDTVASLETAGITGGSYVELSGGTQSSPVLTGKDDQIPVINSENSSLQSVLADAPKLLGKLNQLADSANTVLSPDNVKAISDTFSHIQRPLGFHRFCRAGRQTGDIQSDPDQCGPAQADAPACRWLHARREIDP